MVYIILQWFSGFISFQINFQKVLILIALLAFISSWTYKLKVLNKYSFLPKTPQLTKTFKNQDASRDLNPNLLLNSKQLFSNHDHFNNYLDEFLSAIRVFGFLEKPVFHELARHLQTRRLLAGDTLSLDEDKSFYIVVELSVSFNYYHVDDMCANSMNPPQNTADLSKSLLKHLIGPVQARTPVHQLATHIMIDWRMTMKMITAFNS
jgi:lysophospholipid hydrolase